MMRLKAYSASYTEWVGCCHAVKNHDITFFFGGRGLANGMLAEVGRKIAGVTDAGVEVDLGQPERDITRKLKLSPDARVCDQAFAVQLKVQEFLHDRKLSAVFVSNGWWEKEPGAIVAKAILAILTPPGFRNYLRGYVQFEDVGCYPSWVVQPMEDVTERVAIIE